jgi:hypothetical protein
MRDIARVVDFEWLSAPAREAIVRISDGEYSCYCFCCPCDVSVGHALEQPLLSLDEKGVMRTGSDAELRITSPDGRFRHELVAEVTDPSKGIVRVGAIWIALALPLPGDIASGDKLELVSTRLDLIR